MGEFQKDYPGDCDVKLSPGGCLTICVIGLCVDELAQTTVFPNAVTPVAFQPALFGLTVASAMWSCLTPKFHMHLQQFQSSLKTSELRQR